MSSLSMADKPIMICHVEKPLNYTLYDCKWIPKSAKFVVLGAKPKGTGMIQLYQLVTNDIKLLKTIETSSSIKCGTFGASAKSQKELATGDFDGNLHIWDLETSKKIFDIKGHNEIINCIDAMGGDSLNHTYGPPEICTGSRDGAVKLWDVRQKEKPVVIFEPSDGETKRDCWAVTFGNSYNNEERALAAGYDNGDIKLFDLRTMKLIWEKNVKNGICSIQFDRKDIEMNKLLVTTLESKFHVFDVRVQHPTKGFGGITEKAHKSTIWIGKHVPQNRDLFMTAGGNGSLSLWQYSYPENRSKKDSDGHLISVPGTLNLLQSMTLSTQPLSSFDWSPDKLGLAVSTSFDQNIRLIIVTKLNRY